MDDLMNKVEALIEAHVKSECGESVRAYHAVIVNARSILGACKEEGLEAAAERVVKERDRALAAVAVESKQARGFRDIVGIVGAPNFITPHSDLVALTVDDVRKLRADRDSLAHERRHAQHQLKELLSTLGLAHFDRSTIEGAIKATRERDKRLVAECMLHCADSDKAVREAQALRERVQGLELKLLEVRKAAAENAPEKHAAYPDGEEAEEIEGFRVGDLVQLANMQPPHVKWQAVTKLEGDGRVRYGKYDAYAPHLIARKPIEVGDTVRFAGESKRFRVEKIEPGNEGNGAMWARCTTNGLSSGFIRVERLVAIAP